MIGIKRNLHHKISDLLEKFPAVAILGPRQVGKTTLAQQVCPEWNYIDLENPNDYERLLHDPIFYFSQYPQHVIIDEAQAYPEIFNVLRSCIDKERQIKGRFLITGSSSPELLRHTSETLAGRVAIVTLGTLKVNEYYQKPLSDLYNIFYTKLSVSNLPLITPQFSAQEVHKPWLNGGYPEPLLANDELYSQQWMENYRDTYVNRDVARLFPKLNRFAFQRFLQILCKLSGTIINKSDLARSLEISEGTVREYLTIVAGTFLWRVLPSYEKNILKSVIKMPKGHLTDSGLLHFLLRLSTLNELYENPIIGNSFEGFVIEEIIKGLQATKVTNWEAHYYRTRNGAEIDLILAGPFGLLPIEIKYGSRTKIKQLTALIQFVKEHHLPFGMVVNQSEAMEWLTPQIIQIPVGCL
jgi:predicted AAA+ superfamily ATPase